MKFANTKNFWLLKTEPDTFSIDDLKKVKKEDWTGVRNYQARNFMRDSMKVGDECFFYHSSCEVPGIAGLCKISKVNVVDEPPTWVCVEVEFVEKFNNFISLFQIKELAKKDKILEKMRLLQPGSRLSVQPVTKQEFKKIIKLKK